MVELNSIDKCDRNPTAVVGVVYFFFPQRRCSFHSVNDAVCDETHQEQGFVRDGRA